MPLPALAIPIIYWVAGGSAAAGATYWAYKKSSSSSKTENTNTSKNEAGTSKKHDETDLANKKKQVHVFVKTFYGEGRARDFEYVNDRDRLKEKLKDLTETEKPTSVREMNENLADARSKVRKLEKALKELETLNGE